MSLNLNILQYNNSVNSTLNIVYKDIHLDIEKKYTRNSELYKTSEVTDIVADVNANAIKNSIYNILSTSPGQKILNPEFGLSFEQWLFTNISDNNINIIKQKIISQIQQYEPRAQLQEIDIDPDYDAHEYHITLKINNLPINFNLSETGLILNG